MSPEYALGGMISEKADIYSFGVLLLEIISGKKVNRLLPHNNQQISLIDYVSSFLIYTKLRVSSFMYIISNESTFMYLKFQAWESWCETKGLNMRNDEAILGSLFSSPEAMRLTHRSSLS